jgi:uncharacterized protein (TIGR00369 family)
MSDATRTRTYDWADPALLREAAMNLTGLEFISRMLDKDAKGAPISATIGMYGVAVREGEVTFGIEPQEFHNNPLGSMHGGIFATILDSACGCALHTTLAKGQGFTSLTLEIKFLRSAGKDTGPLLCTGKVVSRGRTVATTEAVLKDGRGRLYATATSTCMIFAAPGTDTKA